MSERFLSSFLSLCVRACARERLQSLSAQSELVGQFLNETQSVRQTHSHTVSSSHAMLYTDTHAPPSHTLRVTGAC